MSEFLQFIGIFIIMILNLVFFYHFLKWIIKDAIKEAFKELKDKE